MRPYQPMFGPDVTLFGVPSCNLDDPKTYRDAKVVVIGAPFDGGTSYRSGTRFGPRVIRSCDYLSYDGHRPHLALRIDPLQELKVVDAGDVPMHSGLIEKSLKALEEVVMQIVGAGAVPLVLGGDHSIALPDVTGLARVRGWGRISVIHFDAHADTGDLQEGSLFGHGTPMRRLIESGAVRGDRFLQIGLRGYWPPPDTLRWMAQQKMRCFEMAEIVDRGLDSVLNEALGIAQDGCDTVFMSVDIDVVDPGMAPGTGTPEPGGLTSRQLLDSVRRICREAPVGGLDIVEVSPPYDSSNITAMLAGRVALEALSGIAFRRRGVGHNIQGPLLADL
jgi:agmatinase